MKNYWYEIGRAAARRALVRVGFESEGRMRAGDWLAPLHLWGPQFREGFTFELIESEHRLWGPTTRLRRSLGLTKREDA